MKTLVFCFALLMATAAQAYKFTATYAGKVWIFESSVSQTPRTRAELVASCVGGLYVLSNHWGGLIQMHDPINNKPIRCEIIYKKIAE